MAGSVSSRILFVSTLLISISLLSSSVAYTSFDYCKIDDVQSIGRKANYPVKISGIQVHPNPIVRGQPAQFNILANAGIAIPKGKVVIDVKYLSLDLHRETKDLCHQTSCPVGPGDFVMSYEQSLPSLAPPGSYTLTMKLLGDNDKTELTCISFGFNIGFLSSSAADM